MMMQWGAWDTLIGLYTALLPPFGSVQRKDEALLNSHLGMLYGRQGDLEQSQHYYHQALAIQHEIGDRHGEATILTNQGELFRIHDEWEKARTNFEQALILNRQEQDPLLQCITLHDLGLLYHSAKEYQSAQSYYLAALKLAYNVSQPSVKSALREPASRNLGTIFTNLGILLYEQKQRPTAMALLLAALQLRQTLHDPGVSILERFLAAIEQKMGKSAYTQLCQEALRIQQQVIASYIA
jgi:tetratricopeptide (TPR) repeat protein